MRSAGLQQMRLRRLLHVIVRLGESQQGLEHAQISGHQQIWGRWQCDGIGDIKA